MSNPLVRQCVSQLEALPINATTPLPCDLEEAVGDFMGRQELGILQAFRNRLEAKIPADQRSTHPVFRTVDELVSGGQDRRVDHVVGLSSALAGIGALPVLCCAATELGLALLYSDRGKTIQEVSASWTRYSHILTGRGFLAYVALCGIMGALIATLDD